MSNFEFKPLTKTGERPPTKTFIDNVTYYTEPLIPLLKYIFAVILLFVFYKKIIIPFSQKMLEETVENEEEMLLEKRIEEEEEGAEDTLEKFRAVKKKVEDQLGLGEEFNEDELKYDVLIEKMKALAESKTDEFANLIQSMLKSDYDIKSSEESKEKS